MSIFDMECASAVFKLKAQKKGDKSLMVWLKI
jgi:hypothetical protein